MKHYVKLFFIIVSFLLVTSTYNQLPPPTTQAVPYYSIRPQGVDAARELVGWTRAINQYDIGCLYGSVSLTAEYARSFNGTDIANSLFSSNASINNTCGIARLIISGSHSFQETL